MSSGFQSRENIKYKLYKATMDVLTTHGSTIMHEKTLSARTYSILKTNTDRI